MHLYRIDTFFLGPDFHPKCEFPWGPRRRIGAQRNQMLNLPSHSTKQVAKLHPVGAGRPKPKTNMSHVTYPEYSIGGDNGLLLTCLDSTLFCLLWWLQWLQWPWPQVCHIQGKPMPFLRITPSFISAWLLAAEEKRAQPEAVIMESLVCGIWPMRASQPEPADTFYDLDDFVFAWFCDRLAADEEVMEEEICNLAKNWTSQPFRKKPTNDLEVPITLHKFWQHWFIATLMEPYKQKDMQSCWVAIGCESSSDIVNLATLGTCPKIDGSSYLCKVCATMICVLAACC